MRNKRTAEPQTEQSEASPTSPAVADSTGREVKRFKKQSDISYERKEKEDKDNTEGDKRGTQTEHAPRRSTLTSPPYRRISLKRLQNVENSLAFGMEMLPAFNKSLRTSSSVQAPVPPCTAPSSFSGDPRPGLNLNFLPPVDKGLFTLLQDASVFCSTKAYEAAVSSLCTALQLASKGHVLKGMQHSDPEDIDLVFSYIQSRLVACYLRMKKPQMALEHAHRSIQLNPSHFQNHLRQATVYRMLGKPWLAAKSVLTADWLYCTVLGGTERHISTKLKLYWQAMLHEAQLKEEGISVMYTPYSGDPTAEHVSQAAEAFMMQNGAFTDFIYTDPKGGHVLPHTVDWLSAPAAPQQYFITLGFRKREDSRLLKKIHSRKWPPFPGLSSECVCIESDSCCQYTKEMLSILDLMQATQINVSVRVGSGLIEWLQYGSLLVKLGYHREHSTIMHRCQAHLATAPYLPQISTQQDNTLVSSCTVSECRGKTEAKTQQKITA
uniref:Uncharacterized protein n=1 Tax=Anabas testudineus TaxID=64144 RepID=A0A3Q1J7H8_ANATE